MIEKREKKRMYCLRIPVRLLDRLQEVAVARQSTATDILVQCLEAGLPAAPEAPAVETTNPV